jgi:hypothetical protein
MPDIIPCEGCGVVLDCTTTDPLDLYRLDGPVVASPLICPTGYDCTQSKFIRMLCCDQELNATLRKGLTQAQRQVIIDTLVQNCRVRQESCGGAVATLYFNSPQQAIGLCPYTAGQYAFTTPAGSYLASTQALANEYALRYARAFVALNTFCVSEPVVSGCVGDAVSTEMRIVGGTAPFSVQLVSGSLAPGLALSISGRIVTMSGVLTTQGTFAGVIRVNDSLGGYWQQTFTAFIVC